MQRVHPLLEHRTFRSESSRARERRHIGTASLVNITLASLINLSATHLHYYKPPQVHASVSRSPSGFGKHVLLPHSSSNIRNGLLDKYRQRGTLSLLPSAFLESSHTDVQAYPPPYLLIPPNQGVSDESGTLLQEEPVSGVPVAGLHHVRPSNSKTPKSTVRLLPASGTSNKDRLNNIHSSTHVDTAFNIPLAPILHGASHLPPVESREKRGLQDRSHPYRKSRKKGAVDSLHWSRRRPEIPKARTDPQFSCDDCGAKYAQKQGLNRHRLEKHNPSLCKYCGAEWGRPYVYRNHLEEHHPDVDRDMELGKQEGSRRRSAVFVRHRLQQVSPPTIGYGLGSFWDQGVHISSGETFNHQPTDMTYGSQFEFTQPIAASKSIPAGAVNSACFALLVLITLFFRRSCANGLDSPEWICQSTIQSLNGGYHRR